MYEVSAVLLKEHKNS